MWTCRCYQDVGFFLAFFKIFLLPFACGYGYYGVLAASVWWRQGWAPVLWKRLRANYNTTLQKHPFINLIPVTSKLFVCVCFPIYLHGSYFKCSPAICFTCYTNIHWPRRSVWHQRIHIYKKLFVRLSTSVSKTFTDHKITNLSSRLCRKVSLG